MARVTTPSSTGEDRRSTLVRPLCSTTVTAAFFDLDKTVIAKASMVAFGRPLLRAGMISRRLLLRGMWSHLLFQRFGADEAKMQKVREQALRLTRGWEQARINTIVRETLIDVIEPIVFEEALELIRRHQAEGTRVFIISASPEEIVAPLAEYLGVDEAIASRARIDDEGRYTGEVDFYSYGPFKAEAMVEVAELEGIDLAASYAYSDSITDLPMLEVVGHPTAVNPDRELGRIAAERGWEVRHFDHPVPLRARMPMPQPRTAVLAAGLAGASLAVAAMIWWARRPNRDSRTPPARGARPHHRSLAVRCGGLGTVSVRNRGNRSGRRANR